MENQELINKVVENAQEAYAFVNEKGLTKPLLNASKSFINWFNGLFTRKAHKERLELLEKLQQTENDIAILKSELTLQVEENTELITTFKQKVSELEKEKSNEPNQNTVKIIKSKNVLANVKEIKVQGNFHIGDNSDKQS